VTGPLAPYAYEVLYGDGRRLRWDSPGGPWGEAKLPWPGVTLLRILGPSGLIRLAPPPDALGLVLRMRGVITFTAEPSHVRRWAFGFRLPMDMLEGWRVLEGRPHYAARYHGPLEAW
jgi:hypothetical protein